jgi:NAD(P)-dependent dehydrogenase (short-subunit alcohol dehydrogenase family)
VRPVLDTDIDQAKKIFGVNLWGMVAATQAFAPLVIAAKGSIVNNSSLPLLYTCHGIVRFFIRLIVSCFTLEALLIFPAIRSASKAAMKVYSETLHLEMAPFGVKVVIVMTGMGSGLGKLALGSK